MSFDSSRFTFSPRKNFLGVVMQQGRVQLDSDWNEWQAEFARRIQAGTLDTLGSAVYPATTPNAFQITASVDAGGTQHVSIGAGRYYVDGLLAECHGPAASAQWDPALAEMSGAPQTANAVPVTVDYLLQPYLPGAALPSGNGPFLAYLDVWQREVTYLEDPYLIEKAVGVDTTGRLQTVWEVKLLDVSSVAGGVTCSTPPSTIPAWVSLIRPSAGQLTNGFVPSAASGPCCLTPNTGYTGMENQLYRIEIHQGGTALTSSAAPAYPLPSGSGIATFKWSRDNASVATPVTAIASVTVGGSSASQLTVVSMGRDQVLGFAPGNWIEITDDYQELNPPPGQPHGELHKIVSINAAALTITLDSTVLLNGGQADATRHTRIQRWDQGYPASQIYQTDSSGNTTLWVDLDAPGSTGDIPIPPAGTTLVLENGLTVAFGLNPTTGSFDPGDFWNFAARAVDGTVEQLTQAPSRGIHHHYAWLSVVTFPTTASNCRIEWPPSETGCACGCTVTVQPSEITTTNSLQSIVNQYQNQPGPTVIALMPGTYSLPSPLRLTAANSNVTLQACQSRTALIQAQTGQEGLFSDGLVVLDGANGITLNGIQFIVPLTPFSPTTFAGLPVSDFDPDVASMVQNLVVSIGVRPVNCNSLTLEDCQFDFADFEEDISNQNATPFGVGVFASGRCSNFQLQGNQFGGVGDFLAGFLLSPSVAFAPPPNIGIVPIPGKPILAKPATGLTGTDTGVLKGKKLAANLSKAVSPATTPKTVARPKTSAAKTVPALNSKTIAFSPVIGKLRNILNRGTSTPNLAANGGTVIPATLNDAVFKENSFFGMTVAVLILGKSETVEFTANEVEDGNAGFWLVSPLQAEFLLADPQFLALIGASVAMGYPMPQADNTPTITIPAAPASVRIYTGASSYTDSQGNVWTPDASSTAVTISGATPYAPTPAPAITGALPSSTDAALYQSERNGTSFSYTFTNLPSGYYQLTLKFAEITQDQAGTRIFDVSVNGLPVLTNFDIVADVGGDNIADDKLFTNILPNPQSQIVVQFTGTFSKDVNAKISALELDPQWSGTPIASTTQEGELANFFDQLAQLAEQGFASLALSPSQLRFKDNEMQGLSAPGFLIIGDDSLENGNAASLMMSGNRLDGTLSRENYDKATFEQTTDRVAGATSSATAQGPFFNHPNFGITNWALPSFLCIATIIQVSRCVVSGNMMLNEANDGLSFYLNDSPVSSAALAVMGNVLKGYDLILPPPSPPPFTSGTPIPAPMNSWGFFNTVIVT